MRIEKYDVDVLVETWLRQSEAHDHARNVEQFARYAPELGWRSILAVLEHPRALPHLHMLEPPLRMLIAQYGPDFIDRIEIEAARSPVFRQLFGGVHADPVFRIPESLWERLTKAAGKPVGPMPAHMVALYTKMPDLAEIAALDLDPSTR